MNNHKSQNVLMRLVVLIVVMITLIAGLLMPTRLAQAGPIDGGGPSRTSSTETPTPTPAP